MKYLKKYKLFLEVTLAVSDTDTPDVKMSKENINLLGQQLSDYKVKKVQIDGIYKNTIEDSKIESLLLSLLGNKESDRNPFLIDYLNISKIERNIRRLNEKNVDAKVRLDTFKQELLSAEDSSKQIVTDKIANITKEISETTKKILDSSKEFKDAEVKHNEKMLKIESDIKDYISKISNDLQK